ncbi:MAG: biopolymer transporter ExbD [Lentisphaeria bacterium]|nr:biopolymer transporter ExbD [Lentisphaeria bacterium]
MLRRNRKKDSIQTVSQLDVTPMVDLTFLLLIVFMITAPVLEQVTDVSPPEMSAQSMDNKDSILLSVNANGQYYLGSELTPLNNILNTIQKEKVHNPTLEIFIRGDKNVDYGVVIELMKKVKDAGFDKVSLVTIGEE